MAQAIIVGIVGIAGVIGTLFGGILSSRAAEQRDHRVFNHDDEIQELRQKREAYAELLASAHEFTIHQIWEDDRAPTEMLSRLTIALAVVELTGPTSAYDAASVLVEAALSIREEKGKPRLAFAAARTNFASAAQIALAKETAPETSEKGIDRV